VIAVFTEPAAMNQAVTDTHVADDGRSAAYAWMDELNCKKIDTFMAGLEQSVMTTSARSPPCCAATDVTPLPHVAMQRSASRATRRGSEDRPTRRAPAPSRLVAEDDDAMCASLLSTKEDSEHNGAE